MSGLSRETRTVSGASLTRWWVTVGCAALEAPAIIASFDDVAVVSEAIEQRGGHLGVVGQLSHQCLVDGTSNLLLRAMIERDPAVFNTKTQRHQGADGVRIDGSLGVGVRVRSRAGENQVVFNREPQRHAFGAVTFPTERRRIRPRRRYGVTPNVTPV